MEEKEEWRGVRSFSRYEVSSLGRVRRKAYIQKTKTGKKKPVASKICEGKVKGNSSRSVTLFDTDGFLETKRICDLVAEAFLPQPLFNAIVKRKDGVMQNDRADNLEWVRVPDNQEEIDDYIFFTEVREWEKDVVIYGRLGVRHTELNGDSISKIVSKAKQSYMRECKKVMAAGV